MKRSYAWTAAGIAVCLMLIGQELQTVGAAPPPVLLGLYPWGLLGGADGSVVQIEALDEWSGMGNSIAATFMDLDDPNVDQTVPDELNAAWNAGYTPFVNLAPQQPGALGLVASDQPKHQVRFTAASSAAPDCGSKASANDIASGLMDAQITAWAEAFAAWSNGGEKRAFIAPLQEMNGDWVCYSLQPADFRKAFVRIRDIFDESGVQADSVSWVFAPNGWSEEGAPSFEQYYPGNTFVDIVSFSAYNFAGCSPFPAHTWTRPEMLFGEYYDRLRALAPGKPIFIAETGTTSWFRDPARPLDPPLRDRARKDEWLAEAYAYLANLEAMRAILYFNVDEIVDPNSPSCDFPFYQPPFETPDEEYVGYRTTVNDPELGFEYISPTSIESLAFQRLSGVFEDVWPVHPFAGVPDPHWYRPWVEALALAGITGGCRIDEVIQSLTYYCPKDTVTRAQMAVFLLRGEHGSAYTPMPIDGGVFSDTSGHWAEAWIEDLFDEGITSGFPDGTYKPDNNVTRAEMAIFLLKAEHGSAYTPPPPSDPSVFSDIDGHWAEAWIEALFVEGITAGCTSGPPPQFCPADLVTRGQMAIFLVRTFALPMP